MAEWVAFLRRELAPTPGRGGATLRLTLAAVIATIPILTHHIPFALVVMILMYLITQEDTAATLLGSVLAVVGWTMSLGLALLAWMVVLDVAPLRICAFAVFVFGGLFLKRVLIVGALGSALGLPAAIVMMLPDVAKVQGGSSAPPETLTELLLWLALTVPLGLGVNLGVQLLLAHGDPLTLLLRDLDTRLRVVAETTRRLGGLAVPVPPSEISLESLATSGMTRSLALLKNAALTRSRVRPHRDQLAAIITLVDRLVTDAAALPRDSSPADPITRQWLLRIGDGCDLMRGALAAKGTSPTTFRPDVTGTPAWLPLPDMVRALEQLDLAVRVQEATEPAQAAKPGLLLPDAFSNPEYVQFATKGTVACLICYLLFVGFDYPGIYTSVITCFVVSLSTIGASNQKGALRFGGAALGGLMGLVTLVYIFPNIDGIGGFWLVFGAGTAVAAWINFGTPRVAYGGYQTGLAFYKAVLQGFGPAVSATVLRDRLVGVALGLIVFDLVERTLWPVRAADRMRERLADALEALGQLAKASAAPGGIEGREVDGRRRLIGEQVADVQGFIESSKFEYDAGGTTTIQRLTGDAQTVFIVLLALIRGESPRPLPEATRGLLTDVAAALQVRAEALRRGGPASPVDLRESLVAVERDVSGGGPEKPAAGIGRVALCRELVDAVHRLASDDGTAVAAPGRSE